MVDFLHAWLFVLLRGGRGGRVVTNAKYAPWFGGAAVGDGAGARWAVFRKTRINEVPLDLVSRLGRDFRCRLENARFIVLGRGAGGRPSAFFDTVFGPREAGDEAGVDELVAAIEPHKTAVDQDERTSRILST